MLKKVTWLLLTATLVAGFFSFRSKFYGSQPPTNHSGAPGGFGLCSDCHGNLNTGGGSVVVDGLPSSFQPGVTYPFSVTITHPTTRGRWGFEINARNGDGAPAGTFSSTNPNADINGGPSEIAHKGAVFSEGTSYTYSNLSWTAPSAPGTGDNQVRFYIAGNAANGNSNATGDFIYTSTTLITLPITLQSLQGTATEDNKIRLAWRTATESNSKEFVIEKSEDNDHFVTAGRVAAAGTSSSERMYSFTDEQPTLLPLSTLYYRLKLVDRDGAFRYSKTVKVELKSKALFVQSVFPNPAIDKIYADVVVSKATQAEVKIVTANGAVIEYRLLSLQKGRKIYEIPLPALQSGTFFLLLQTKEHRQTVSFIVL